MDLQFGMPDGVAGIIAKKYAIQQQGADAQTLSATAAANLENERTRLLPTESAANVGLTNAQAAGVRTTTSLAPGLAASQISLQGNQGSLYGQQARAEDIMSRLHLGLGGQPNGDGSFSFAGGMNNGGGLLNGTRIAFAPNGNGGYTQTSSGN